MTTAKYEASGAAQLRMASISKTFPTAKGKANVLRDISLEVQRGEFVSLIGHSGCGKSTLLNMIAGLQKPTTGSLLFEGTPISGPGPERAMVFQNYSLFPWLTVYQNVFEAVHAVQQNLPRADKVLLVQDFLARVGLTPHQHKKPYQLSGGMRQRVAIARAFAVHPRVLLLDEPFGALDALTRSSLQEELINIWQGDAQTETVIMVTHDIDEAIYLSDRIVVFSNGPGATIREIITVPFGRPRERRELLHRPEWIEIKDELIALLHQPHAEQDVARSA